eukprot:CAMPEP_0185755870 /NCGR_PEP_ID=MMETSP1174-20130828/14338_1 /TAXON_ID=35687 /ORGANISM="Dictyocha speculum, Strain CCMP1381" /LENGTH=269 /DNA_ID=CAMNT_0028434593 /DNA_START=155 /DNA_END=964 /DNA_ORIENTATION=-
MTITELDDRCPSWKTYVSTDELQPDKIHQLPASTVQGMLNPDRPTTALHYASIVDWAVDLASGFGNDCDPTSAQGCESIGAHVLSIPRQVYVRDCCSDDGQSIASLLESGQHSLVCPMLRDMVRGGVRAVKGLKSLPPSCALTNLDPTAANQCLAQCFHYTPDIFYAHLHTSAVVNGMRDGPYNSGLGPNANMSEAETGGSSLGEYNVCVCEPETWQVDGRGYCPTAQPDEDGYTEQAAMSLCQNIAGASMNDVDKALCDLCESSAYLS